MKILISSHLMRLVRVAYFMVTLTKNVGCHRDLSHLGKNLKINICSVFLFRYFLFPLDFLPQEKFLGISLSKITQVKLRQVAIIFFVMEGWFYLNL